MCDQALRSSPLLRIPNELITSVAFYLSLADLGEFRLSCKAVDAALFHAFAREHFETRQFMVEHSNLDTLVWISQSLRVAPYLKHLLILTLRYDLQSDPRHVDAINDRWLPYNILLASGQARDMLVYALSRLPNLVRVGIRDYVSIRADRPGSCTRSLSVERDFTSSQQTFLVFELLLAALHRAPSAKPVELEVISRHRVMSTAAFRTPIPNAAAFIDSPYAGAPLTSVKKLLLTVSLDQGTQLNVPGTRSSSINRLIGFLQSGVPNIEMLRLNFCRQDVLADQFFHQMATLRPLRGASSFLPHITRLELGVLSAHSQTLVNVLSRWPLKGFALWRVDLLNDHFATSSDPAWSNLLLELSTAMPATIEAAMLGSVGQIKENSSGYYPQARIAFATVDTPAGAPANSTDQTCEWIVNYELRRQGQSIGDWLRGLAQRVRVQVTTAIGLDSDGESDVSDE